MQKLVQTIVNDSSKVFLEFSDRKIQTKEEVRQAALAVKKEIEAAEDAIAKILNKKYSIDFSKVKFNKKFKLIV